MLQVFTQRKKNIKIEVLEQFNYELYFSITRKTLVSKEILSINNNINITTT